MKTLIKLNNSVISPLLKKKCFESYDHFAICIRFHKNISSFKYLKKFLDMFLEEDKHVLVWLLKGDTQQNDIKINLVSLAVENNITKIL